MESDGTVTEANPTSVFRPARWTAGGYVWVSLGGLVTAVGGIQGSVYTAVTGLCLVGFAPVLAWFKNRHIFWTMLACTGLFALVLGVTALFTGAVDPSYRQFNKAIHLTVAGPFDYVGQFWVNHPLMAGAGFANVLLVWMALSLILWWFKDALGPLGSVLFPVRWRWFAPFLFCLGFGVASALGVPVSDQLGLETRKNLGPLAFNVVTVWLVVWHGWLIAREAKKRFHAVVYAFLNGLLFFRISFFAGLILIHRFL